MKLLNISDHLEGDVFTGISNPVHFADEIDEIVNTVMKLWKQFASISDFGDKEKKCTLYIGNIIQTMLPIFSNNLHFDAEYFVKNEQFGGELDMVIHAYTPTKIPVVCIVEAKKNDINQGRAQLYPQLKICHDLAKKVENWNHPVYGVISTVKEWIFVRFDGEDWLESPSFMVSSARDRDGIQKVIESFYKIIHHQNMLVEDLVLKCKLKKRN